MLLWSYLWNVLPHIDVSVLQTLQELAPKIPETDRAVFLEELARYHVGSVVPASVNTLSLMLSPHVWRQRVYALVQDIVGPESLAWMDDDDDDAAFIPYLCRRSLNEIQVRFEQYVILTVIWIHDWNQLIVSPVGWCLN